MARLTWPDVAGLFPEDEHVTELRRRLRDGHTASCACQSRPGKPCQELRRLVGWEMLQALLEEHRDRRREGPDR